MAICAGSNQTASVRTVRSKTTDCQHSLRNMPTEKEHYLEKWRILRHV